MDPQLKAYMDTQFAGLNGRLDGIDGRLDAHGGRFDAIEGRLEAHDRRFDEIKDEIRQGRVLLEDLDSNVKAVAEGYAALDEKLDRFRQEIRIQRREDRIDNRVAFRALKQRDDGQEGRIVALEAAGV